MSDLSSVVEKFVNSGEFVEAVVSSTKAGWGGSGYSVEVFADGTWRVLWDNQIGNAYMSSGMIVAIPQLTQEQVNEVDEDNPLELVAEFYRDELAEEILEKASYPDFF